MENIEEITIESDCWHTESQINIKDLFKIEISLIASMFYSQELFSRITELISEEDLTFVVNKRIFNHLKLYSKDVQFYGNEDEKTNIAGDIYAFDNISIKTTLRILDSKPSENIDIDLTELLHFSNKRKEVSKQIADDGNYYSNLIIEDEFGHYEAIYFNGIIKEIYTTYIFILPKELCDTFKYTFEKMMVYIDKDNNNLVIHINENNQEEVKGFTLIKNINKIELLKKVIMWSNKKEFDEVTFPKNRGYLQSLLLFELDKLNLEYIPDEFCESLTQIRFLSLLHNKIKKIPDNIHLLKHCILLGLCDNKIESLPDNLFELKKLSILCLHCNAIKEIPSRIGNLVALTSLTLSNNPIQTLPSTVNQLINLNQLDIENTFINEDSLKYINLENIEKISFNDKLLPYLIENFHLLKNIDTINLNHSEYKIDDPVISSLKLNLEFENWMEDKDYKGNGCIILKNSSENGN